MISLECLLHAGFGCCFIFLTKMSVCLMGDFCDGKRRDTPLNIKLIILSPLVSSESSNRKVLVTFSEVKKSLRRKDTVIVDARTKDEFTGEHIRAARAGHIPAAINIDWQRNIKGESFKGLEQLRSLYSNIPKNSRIITYCQGGYRAANSFLALKILGYKDVRMYLGSWGEWGNKPNLPIE